MRRVFIDTGAFYALADRSDRHHVEAIETAGQLSRRRIYVFTSDYVVAESHVLMMVRLGHEIARKWVSTLDVQIEFGTQSDLEAAKRIITSHTDKDYSLTDALSMAIMRRMNTEEVFGFDSHFTSAGFNLISSKTGLS
ncbi:MAG: PIN domain-containing protein [Myxococcota bacterium]|jgi:predicted nucleic acid-binding protein